MRRLTTSAYDDVRDVCGLSRLTGGDSLTGSTMSGVEDLGASEGVVVDWGVSWGLFGTV